MTNPRSATGTTNPAHAKPNRGSIGGSTSGPPQRPWGVYTAHPYAFFGGPYQPHCRAFLEGLNQPRTVFGGYEHEETILVWLTDTPGTRLSYTDVDIRVHEAGNPAGAKLPLGEGVWRRGLRKSKLVVVLTYRPSKQGGDEWT